ncbi:hypothetical protein MIND_00653900 [Mycena indigotica]|uniref:Uncharacterized protein n=1 Tax=Mycena indigotica TaxID=2126181 RepID=A0A8H6W436_9AGAR|nr:uncharacterized protein MIND_00653900 [Mycena indigotica]KAF7304217.1 hypothetical protein MIND_00653900 [Mycena indigotica]
MRYSLALLVSAVLAPLSALAAPAATVIVPGGPKAAADVHQIPAGGRIAHVNDQVHVFDAAGSIVKKVSVGVRPTPVRNAVAPLQTGWITYASWLNQGSSPISSFTTTWTVPPVPATNHGQTIFLFNSIEPNSGDAIIQPVLQYGPSAAGGGSFWGVASWYLVGNSVFNTAVTRVSAGQTLNGVITLTSQSGSSFNYVTSFSNIAGTSLTVTGAAQLTWATETLEAYAVTAISDYPAGSTKFSGINLKLANGATPSISWSTAQDSAEGLTTTVNTNGATNAVITIKY